MTQNTLFTIIFRLFVLRDHSYCKERTLDLKSNSHKKEY